MDEGSAPVAPVMPVTPGTPDASPGPLIPPEAASPPTPTPPAQTVGHKAWTWLSAAARVLTLRTPRWETLDGSPLTAATFALLIYLLNFAVERAFIEGPATVDWSAVLNGWAALVVKIWTCWIVVRSLKPGTSPSITTGTLVSLLCATELLLGLVQAIVLLVPHSFIRPFSEWHDRLQLMAWLVPLVWIWAATIKLLLRTATIGMPRLLALVLTGLSLAISHWLQPVNFWWPQEDDASRPKYMGLPITEAVVAAQAHLLPDALDALHPPLPDRVNVYAATYAPYAPEDVFMHESALVANTMTERFATSGRTVQLVLNPATGTTIPWATPSNLRLTIQGMAAVMNRDRDVFFLHLTSHGGRDGKLAVYGWPLESDPVTPTELKQWLDEAGIRWRVISISACYSGSWIAPLAGDGTLVMTAADATHTSYGCGSRSPLTFFGRAMYEDALKTTWSFTEAHAKARQLIDVREKEAGKSDGYSNPQISEGAAIHEVLQRLERQQRGQ